MVYMMCMLLETLLVVVKMYGDVTSDYNFLYSVELRTTNLDLWSMLWNSLSGWKG